jgi:hypothetical protein
MKNQSIIVLPVDTITFSVREVRGDIIIENPTDKTILYKVKSNANFKVMTKPSSRGTLEPGESRTVTLTCQDFDPQTNWKNTKFVIMWTSEIVAGDTNLKTMWSKISRDKIGIVSLNCHFQTSKPEPSEPAENPEPEVETYESFLPYSKDNGFGINFYGQVAFIALLGIIFGEIFFG